MAPSRTTVLVVDDDDDMRLLVKLKLELSGDIDVVAEAVDGIDALDAYERLEAPPVPQIVLLDNRMPGMTGLEVATHILGRVPDQRIILYTAHVDEDTTARAQDLGITEVVSKSNLAELPSIIRRIHST